jgi:Protein of unknown function (DUF4232)
VALSGAEPATLVAFARRDRNIDGSSDDIGPTFNHDFDQCRGRAAARRARPAGQRPVPRADAALTRPGVRIPTFGMFRPADRRQLPPSDERAWEQDMRRTFLLALPVTVLLTACGGSSGSAASVTGATPSSAASATASGGGGGSPAGRCAAADLAVTLGAATAVATDQYRLPVTLTDRSSRACAVTGFPGVELVAGDGSTYDVARSPLVPITRIVLAPGASGHADLTYLSTAASEQGAFIPTSVLVTPPDTVTSVRVGWDRGPVVDQSGATHPGTYIMAFAAD